MTGLRSFVFASIAIVLYGAISVPGLAQTDPHAGHHMTGSGLDNAGAANAQREATGTSWQPDITPHEALHFSEGPWAFMIHGDINGVFDHQPGPRGAEKAFVSGMIMASAQRSLNDADTILFRTMLSPDAFMGKGGYPVLLAAGETADGKTGLVDRQHPHDLFVELAARYSHRLDTKDAVFVYAGLPGEPAFGPPVFMHRLSIMDNPEASIAHHWLDSTHITEGVVTLGWSHENWKLEASEFKGREPDQHRFDIESPSLNSTAVRVSWNPTPNWALQISAADQKSPEQLHDDGRERRVSASGIYTVPFGAQGIWSSTLAWGQRKAHDGPGLDALALESALKPDDIWTVFSRFEVTRTDELAGALVLPAQTVSKLSAGVIHDWRLSGQLKLGLGGLVAINFIPDVLAPSYGGSHPLGTMIFLRLKLV
jgi:hypothetical protein